MAYTPAQGLQADVAVGISGTDMMPSVEVWRDVLRDAQIALFPEV